MKDELKRIISKISPNAVLVTENMDEALMEISEVLGCDSMELSEVLGGTATKN